MEAADTRPHRRRRGSVRTAGLIVAGVVGAVVLGLLIYIASSTSRGSPGDPARPEVPSVLPPAALPSGTSRRGATVERMRSTRMQWADRNDPSRLAGEIVCEAMEPLEESRFAVEKPRAWIYMRDGRVIYAEAEKGNLHIPEQARGGRPESGRLTGNVRAMVFAAGDAPPDPARDEPLVEGRVDSLSFDATLGETKSSDEVTVRFAQGRLKASGFTFVYNEVRQRLEYLSLGPGESEVDPEAGTPAKPPPPTPGPATAPAASAAPPAGAPTAGVNPLINAAPAPELAPPREDFYKAVFTGAVEVTQFQRRISGDTLHAWAFLLDNSLRPNALGNGGGASKPESSATKVIEGDVRGRGEDLPTSSAPGPQSPPPAAPGIPVLDAPAEAPASAVVRLTWSERVQVRPLETRPPELAEDDVALRFLAPGRGAVEMEDRERGVTGRAAEFDYFATRRVAAWRDPAEDGVKLAQAGRGLLAGSDVRYAMNASVGHVRGPGAIERESAEPSDGDEALKPARVAWREQADFTLAEVRTGEAAGAMRLRDAMFRGQVDARDGDSAVRGEFVHAIFAESGDELYLSRVRINENAFATDGRGGELSADDVDAAFRAGPTGDPDPEFIAARGNVLVRRGEELLRAGLLNAQLRRAESGEVIVTNVQAKDSVRYNGADEVTARADVLTADPRAQTAHLTGPGAWVARGSSVVAGPSIRLDGIEREINVDGPGTFAHEGEERDGFRPTVESRWVQRMRFNDRTGEVECEGATLTRHAPEPLTIETVESERVTLEFTPLQEPDQADDNAERSPAARRLLHATAYGSGREPATVESRKTSANEENVLEKLLFLEAPRIHADNELGMLTAAGPGRMLSSDRRAAEKPKAGEDDLGRGDALFAWRGSFVFDRVGNTATMEQEVHVTHLRTGAARPVELECRKLVAHLKAQERSTDDAALPAAGGRLSRAVATGAVWARSEAGVEIVADSADYDAEKGVMLLSAVEGNEVAMFDPRSASPVRAREILWDLAGDRIQIRKPSVATPR